MTDRRREDHPLLLTIFICVGVTAGVIVAVLAHDVVIGVIVGALAIAVPSQILRLWSGHGRVRHP